MFQFLTMRQFLCTTPLFFFGADIFLFDPNNPPNCFLQLSVASNTCLALLSIF